MEPKRPLPPGDATPADVINAMRALTAELRAHRQEVAELRKIVGGLVEKLRGSSLGATLLGAAARFVGRG